MRFLLKWWEFCLGYFAGPGEPIEKSLSDKIISMVYCLTMGEFPQELEQKFLELRSFCSGDEDRLSVCCSAAYAGSGLAIWDNDAKRAFEFAELWPVIRKYTCSEEERMALVAVHNRLMQEHLARCSCLTSCGFLGYN